MRETSFDSKARTVKVFKMSVQTIRGFMTAEVGAQLKLGPKRRRDFCHLPGAAVQTPGLGHKATRVMTGPCTEPPPWCLAWHPLGPEPGQQRALLLSHRQFGPQLMLLVFKHVNSQRSFMLSQRLYALKKLFTATHMKVPQLCAKRNSVKSAREWALH